MFYLSPVHFKTVAHTDDSVSRTYYLHAVRRSARPSIQLETRELRVIKCIVSLHMFCDEIISMYEDSFKLWISFNSGSTMTEVDYWKMYTELP